MISSKRREAFSYYKRYSFGLEIEHLDRLCAVLKCQPGDLLEWTEDDKGAMDDKPK